MKNSDQESAQSSSANTGNQLTKDVVAIAEMNRLSITKGPDIRLGQVRFWLRQVHQVKEGGLFVLLRKCLAALKLAPAIPIVLTLRALRPLVLIRFGQLQGYAIGHYAGNTEMYLCERDAGLHPKRTIDIFHHSHPISNQQLKKMWDRTLHIPPFGMQLYLANNLLPGGTRHVVPFPEDQDLHGVVPDSKVHLSFTPEEERKGQACLRALGVPEGAPFVCIYARDTAYRSEYAHSSEAGRSNYRNASIHNYVPVAEELVRRGYFVIRMGAMVNEPMRTTNPMIIDYATIARSAFLDIFLSARCWFFLGCTGGLCNVPKLFRRPLISANFGPLSVGVALGLYPGGLLLLKKLWYREESRFMTFREFLETFPDRFLGDAHYQNIGVDVIENTPEELLDIAVEMDERMKGTWQTTKEDEELQQRFWALIKMGQPNQEFWPRMGAEFLRQNLELLD